MGGILKSPVAIKVVGLGAGGAETVRRLINSDLHSIQFITISNNPVSTKAVNGEAKTHIHMQLSGPSVQEKKAELRKILQDADMIFLIATEGDETETASVISQLVNKAAIRTTGIMTCPFLFEQHKRPVQAERNLRFLREAVETLVIIPDESSIVGLLSGLGA